MTADPVEPPGPADSHYEHADMDCWLTEAHAGLAADVAAYLDLDAGLRDATLAAVHTDLIVGVAARLDLDTGLTAILRPARNPAEATGAAQPPPSAQVPGDIDPDLAPVAALLALPAEARLRLRGSQAFDALTEILAPLTAFAIVRDLALTLALGRAFNSARERARDLVIDIDRVRDLTRDLTRARARARGHTVASTPVRDHDRAVIRAIAGHLDRAIARARDRARHLRGDLDHARDPDLVRNLDRALVLARDLDDALALTRAHTRHLDEVPLGNPPAYIDPDLADVLDQVTSSVIEIPDTPDTGRIVARCLQEIRWIRDDFTRADLRHVDLTNLRLDGVRWSRSNTHWPVNDLAEIELISEPVGPNQPDLFVIRGGTAEIYIPAAP